MKKTAAMFDDRNELKKKLEFGKSRKKDAKVWEIWWYWEWVNIGSEISKDGKFLRPCLILKKNQKRHLLLITPFTSNMNYRGVSLQLNTNGTMKKSSILCIDQIKRIDNKRLCNQYWSNIQSIWFINKILYTNFDFLMNKKTSSRRRGDRES